MRRALLCSTIALLPLVALGQDWHDCKPEVGVSFNEMKDSVRRTMTTRMHTSWDEKRFSRFGDIVAVAVLQTVDDSEMAEPGRAKDVLQILFAAFGCPQHCVKNVDDRQPRVTLLLLDICGKSLVERWTPILVERRSSFWSRLVKWIRSYRVGSCTARYNSRAH